MKRRLALLLFAALLMLSPLVSAQSGGAADEARLQDLNALCDALKSSHKNPFTVISEEEFDRRAEALRGRLCGMSDAQFYYELRALVASVGDSHTTIAYTDSNYRHLRALPFAVTRMQGRWYAAILPSEHAGLLGWEAVSIDGMPMEDVFERAKRIISFDNDVWAAQSFSNAVNFLDALQFLGVTPEDADGVTLALRSDGGEERAVRLGAMTEEEIMRASETGGLAQLSPQSLPATAASGYYRALDLDGALFIQYNTCQEAPDLSMADFAAAVAALLDGGSYGRVLLDLRYNTGGDSSVIAPLLDALEQAKARLGFDVAVLIGEATFSSGVLNAVEAKERLDATLVGQPTGGSVNAFGELGYADLPNSPIRLYVSTKYFEPVPGYGRGPLLPDVTVEPSIDDLLGGRDAAVERALGL